MRLAGTSSWRLHTIGGYLCEQALFVRDAAGLEVVIGSVDDVPPLTGVLADVTQVLDSGARRAASEQWRSWWRQILAIEFRDGQDDPGDARARARRRMAEHHAVCDPPTFAALADRTALQTVARASFEDFKRWESSRAAPQAEGLSGSPLAWSLIKQTAEDVAFDRRVGLGEVQAGVAVLPVQGIWWRRVAPGAVLCSSAAATDPTTAQVLLRDAFDSYVLGSA